VFRARGRLGMKTTDPVDAARIELLLAELRLPAVKAMWAKFAAQSDKEGWPAARLLATLAEHEIADRRRRRPRTNPPTVAPAASSVTSPRHGCRSAKPSPASTSMPCRW